jgi:hypothetical protein
MNKTGHNRIAAALGIAARKKIVLCSKSHVLGWFYVPWVAFLSSSLSLRQITLVLSYAIHMCTYHAQDTRSPTPNLLWLEFERNFKLNCGI